MVLLQQAECCTIADAHASRKIHFHRHLKPAIEVIVMYDIAAEFPRNKSQRFESNSEYHMSGPMSGPEGELRNVLQSILMGVCTRCDFVHGEALRPSGNACLVQV